MKKIYLDVCTLCRPFDDQNIIRIRLETDAYYLIIEAIKREKYVMIVSPVHHKEVEAIEETKERVEIFAFLSSFGKKVSIDVLKVRQRAEKLYVFGFGIADAAHIAFAEETADYFISCDTRLLKKCIQRCSDIKAVTPIEFCSMEDLR